MHCCLCGEFESACIFICIRDPGPSVGPAESRRDRDLLSALLHGGKSVLEAGRKIANSPTALYFAMSSLRGASKRKKTVFVCTLIASETSETFAF